MFAARYFSCVIILLTGLSAINAQNTSVNQNIDALTTSAREQLRIDFTKAEILAQQAFQLSQKNKYNKGLCLSVWVLSQIKANTNKGHEAMALLNTCISQMPENTKDLRAKLYSAKGICFSISGNFDSSLYYHNKAIDLFASANDKAYEQLYVSKINIKTADISKASELQHNAQKQFERSGFKQGLAYAFDILGDIYNSQKLYEKSVEAHKKSYSLFAPLTDKQGMASSALHAGNSFFMLVMDDSASSYYRVALRNFNEVGDKNGVALACSNISRIFLEAAKHDSALYYANKALTTIEGQDNPYLEAGTLQHLGDIYADMKLYDMALDHISRAVVKARKIKQLPVVRDCYKSMAEIYEVMGKHDLAHKSLLKAYRLKDSLQPENFTRQLAEMQTKYETEKKENQIKLLEQSNYIKSIEIKKQEQELRVRNLVIALVGLILALIAGWIYFYIQRQKLKNEMLKAEAVRQTEENERQRIAKDIHDELGSGLSKIKFLSELVAAAPDKTALRSGLKSISETAAALVENMRDLIWALNPENTTLDNLVARIREYSHDYTEDFPVELSIDCSHEIPAIKISKEFNRNVFMIVKEALQNIIKHAGASRITISIVVNEAFKLRITDNGKGFNDAVKNTGNGLKNMQARSQAIQAQFAIESSTGQGTTLILQKKLD